MSIVFFQAAMIQHAHTHCRKRGVVVNISSTAATYPLQYMAAYIFSFQGKNKTLVPCEEGLVLHLLFVNDFCDGM